MNNSPKISWIGLWEPIPASTSNGGGQLANTFLRIYKDVNTGSYGLAMTGWAFTGFNNSDFSVVDQSTLVNSKVSICLLTPDQSGLLKISTDEYIADPITNGGGSVVVADFNLDGVDDLFFAAHNESPFVATSSTAYLSNSLGAFDKVQLDDAVMAHSAVLDYFNGQPVVVSGTFQQSNPIYAFNDGEFSVYQTTSNGTNQNYPGSIYGAEENIQFLGEAATVADFKNDGSYFYVTPIRISDKSWNAKSENIAILNFTGPNNIDINAPVQIIDSYLSSLDEYNNFPSGWGTGISQIYRLWNLDLNKDGYRDILVGESMWSLESNQYPSALQILINDTTGHFKESTKALNPMPLSVPSFDYNPLFMDVDGSGIETIFSSGNFEEGRQSNWLLLNDGTGHLHIGLHSEFDVWEEQIDAYFSKIFNRTGEFANILFDIKRAMKFIAIPSEDGSIDFVSQTQASVKLSDPLLQVAYVMANFGVHWNASYDFIENIYISDRNNSKLMRTWAGNDTFTDANANASPAHIDGGLGIDTSSYCTTASKYNITHNSDGSYGVSGYGIADTLVNIEHLQFTDVNVALDLTNDGHAAVVAKILGAVFGKESVTNKEYAGIGLYFMDSGMSYQDLAALALNAAGATSNDAIVSLMWKNVVGTDATAADKAPFIAMLEGGMTPGALAQLAGDTEFNTKNIGLVGLASTGLEYLPLSV